MKSSAAIDPILRAACSILVLLLTAASPAALSSGRPMTVDDTMEMTLLEDVLISPDGSRVFYSERTLDWPRNTYRKQYFMVDAAGGSPEVYVGNEGGRDFRFSPHGKYLSWIRRAGGDEQVFVLPLQGGGEASQLTRHAGGVKDHRWTASGRRLFFTASKPLPPTAQEAWDQGGDAVFVNEGPNGLQAGHWTEIWLFDLEQGAEVLLLDEDLIVEELDVSPDGERLVVVARPDHRLNHPQLAELYLVDARDKRLVRLTKNHAPEAQPVWSPDGKSIAYHAPPGDDYALHHGFLWIMEPDTGVKRRFDSPNQGEITRLTWTSDGRGLLFSEARRSNRNLYRLDVPTGEVRAMTRVTGTLRPWAFSRDRKRMVYSFEDMTTPPDLYVADLDGGNRRRLTRSNPWIETEIDLGHGDVIRWQSRDGREIEGILIMPDRDPTQKVPLMVDIHGGPPDRWGHEFLKEFHIYAGLGYAVLGPNVRGSSGYGDDHLRALIGDVGGGEYEDLIAGVDHLITLGIADPDRLALRGWSWGGILGAFTLTRTNRFKAAGLGAMVGDWSFETGPGLMWDLREHYIGGTHWSRPEEWRRRSALTYVGRVETPTILLHGELDTVSSVGQSLAFFTALSERGVPARFIKFPRQDHDIEEPRLLRICKVEEIRWMQKHVLGQDWDPSLRP